jgi:predicted RNase H-like HicB family nuclease
MRYLIVIEQGESSWGAYVPDLPGCVAVGETEDEVKQLIQEAIEFHLEDLTDSGASIPRPLSRSDYVDVLAA